VDTVTGSANPSPWGVKVVTAAFSPDTTCTAPSSPTATLASPPTVVSGLTVAASLVRSVMPPRESTRWAHTLPVLGSTRATVPPRRSTTVPGMTPALGAEGAGTTVAALVVVPARGSIACSLALPIVQASTAAPSWRTSMADPGATSTATPASICRAWVLNRPYLASTSEVNQIPLSPRSA